MIDQKIILFWKKITVCDNLSVRFLESIHRNCVGMFLSQYRIPSVSFSVTELKKWMWIYFVNDCIVCNKIVVF